MMIGIAFIIALIEEGQPLCYQNSGGPVENFFTTCWYPPHAHLSHRAARPDDQPGMTFLGLRRPMPIGPGGTDHDQMREDDEGGDGSEADGSCHWTRGVSGAPMLSVPSGQTFSGPGWMASIQSRKNSSKGGIFSPARFLIFCSAR